MNRIELAGLSLSILFAGTPALAHGADPDYLDTWTITEARPAPWVVPSNPSTSPHKTDLVGKTITYEKGRIAAPSLLACDKPNYAIRHVRPDYLFQGGLTAPATQAAALGFPASDIPTLETGCEGWFEFHFVDAATAMFALDNMIYTIRRR